MVSVQRLYQLEDIPQERSNQPQPDDDAWPSQGRIEFDRVNLRYRPNTDIVLDDLSFTVEPGSKVGVVGRTGAGKSTISLALSRIVELCGGSIKIDGVDISQ